MIMPLPELSAEQMDLIPTAPASLKWVWVTAIINRRNWHSMLLALTRPALQSYTQR